MDRCVHRWLGEVMDPEMNGQVDDVMEGWMDG